ncbi:MAG: hypothetical protein Q9195_009615 [Heterodermia aff. obscurata]
MQLRDRDGLKTPQRYDNLEYQDRHQNEERQHHDEPETSNDVYRGPVIQYNPHLRPAVFPTIPLDQEVDESLFTSSEIKLQNAPSPRRATQYPQPEDITNSSQSDASSHTLLGDPAMFSITSTDDRWSRELNRDLNTSPARTTSPKMSSAKPAVGIGSKIWNDNMKKLDLLSKRTETDWNIAEMETSEEDEAEEEIKTQAQHNPKHDFAWDCLAVVHRLCIVDAVDESYDCLDTTFKALHLTSKQKDETLALLAERNEYIDAEVRIHPSPFPPPPQLTPPHRKPPSPSSAPKPPPSSLPAPRPKYTGSPARADIISSCAIMSMLRINTSTT